MTKKIDFHAVDFFRKVRDEQAAALAGKSPVEIVAFFSRLARSRPTRRPREAEKPSAPK